MDTYDPRYTLKIVLSYERQRFFQTLDTFVVPQIQKQIEKT